MFFFCVTYYSCFYFFFFFQAEDGIRDRDVTGVQTCALPISTHPEVLTRRLRHRQRSKRRGGPGHAGYRRGIAYEHHSESRVRSALACRCSGSSRCSASPDDGGCRRERTLGAVGPPRRCRILRFVALAPCQRGFTRGHCLLARLVSKTWGPRIAATRHPRS